MWTPFSAPARSAESSREKQMPEKFTNLIGGRRVPARSGRTFCNTNPATGEVLGEFPASGPEDVNDAVEAAAAAYKSWRLTPAPKPAGGGRGVWGVAAGRWGEGGAGGGARERGCGGGWGAGNRGADTQRDADAASTEAREAGDEMGARGARLAPTAAAGPPERE